MSIRRSLALLVVPAATLALTVTPAMASTARPAAPSGTKIIVADTAFGSSLAVGSGPYKNYTLYFISSDHDHSYGCTPKVIPLPFGPPGFTCTGPSNDKNAEWPAITTNGAPVAEAGREPGAARPRLPHGYRLAGHHHAGHPLATCSTSSPARSPARAGSNRACRRGTASGGSCLRAACRCRGPGP